MKAAVAVVALCISLKSVVLNYICRSTMSWFLGKRADSKIHMNISKTMPRIQQKNRAQKCKRSCLSWFFRSKIRVAKSPGR